MKKLFDNLFTDDSYINLAHVITYILIAAIVIYILYTVIILKFFPRKYHGLKWTTKNITTVALMAALSATVVVVISMTVPITVFPPIRIGFEGMMIKMAGMFFGPIAGIIVGLVTELLTLLFVPSFVHWAYLVMAVGFGFISGLASYSRRIGNGHKKWWIFAFINVFVILCGIFIFFATENKVTDSETMKFWLWEVPGKVYRYLPIAVYGFTLLIIWIIVFTLEGMKKDKLLGVVLPIILMVVLTEFLITTPLSPLGNSKFLGIPSGSGYSSVFLIDAMKAPIHMAWNTAVLSTIFWVLRPLIESKKIGTYSITNESKKSKNILKIRR